MRESPTDFCIDFFFYLQIPIFSQRNNFVIIHLSLFDITFTSQINYYHAWTPVILPSNLCILDDKISFEIEFHGQFIQFEISLLHLIYFKSFKEQNVHPICWFSLLFWLEQHESFPFLLVSSNDLYNKKATV